MVDQEEIVMYDSDEAATYKTGLSGWISRHGRFFGEHEDIARYDGSTHRQCERGNVYEKGWTVCRECREKRQNERYEAMPYKEWGGEPLVSLGCDNYMWDVSDVEDFLSDFEGDELLP